LGGTADYAALIRVGAELEGYMSNGVDRRSQIDTEMVKALTLINGGGAIALLTLFPHVLNKTGYEPLAKAIMYGVLVFVVGLVSAVIHNRFRRICSLIYDQHNMRPPKGQIAGFELREPTTCVISIALMWISIVAFLAGTTFVAVKGIVTINSIPAQHETANK
jgi:hypothetical protein